MKVIAIIPARYDSTRFPGKPLAKLGNKYIIQHVYEQAQKSGLFAEVIVGTDDQRIFEAVEGFAGKVILTSKKHKSGTDRVAEVCGKMLICEDADVIINVQGDEPFITEKPLRKLIEAFDDPKVMVASLMHEASADIENPNVVKVVCDENNNALNFSRSPIPYSRTSKTGYFKHIGVYAFRRKTLFEFVELPESRLEKIEKLEQLRLLENGYKIRMVITEYKGIGIDTPQDLERAENLLKMNK
ncbi:MAG: 3-deoxy-manno-octulosonate cytidylyltransferase [Candidatus Cloacimonetes bacterium]|jgi:3-deoxy-manno-octulosonate cytidylyltransferase (CMP-KDO synthetase)|nr:3-deoxy-manno-octulosonate cytidylyltransferase [Candidatus Cloacimonadota bacterium]